MLLRAAPARALGPFARCVAPLPPTRAQVRLEQCRELLAASSLAPPADPPQRPQPPTRTLSLTLSNTRTQVLLDRYKEMLAGAGSSKRGYLVHNGRVDADKLRWVLERLAGAEERTFQEREVRAGGARSGGGAEGVAI